ncbi:electron transport complex subunit RsxC [Orenia marismortui]|uniref:electron transport complex subunit RsxC n=1 Tax=Orenia marismortui TaxID=46469 RepID=UPI000363B329|nr:electron transport complex subunit RsxC [Orenia marismortui]
MKERTFEQGIHPKYNKELTEHKALKFSGQPEEVIIPLQQHIGSPAKPIVKVGDKVDLGQKIAQSSGFVSADIHASVSGEVIAIEQVNESLAIRIKNDGEDRKAESIGVQGGIEDLSAEEIKEIIKEAGIVGLGGATFPSHVKVSIPEGKNVDKVILNGAECEPYLTVDHRTMVEETEKVLYGLKALMKVVDAKEGYIGIETNKADAIAAMTEVSKNEKNISIVPLEVKYPQGGEKQLIKAILGEEVPSGGLPLDVGVVVNNIGTAVAVTDAIQLGMPLIQRAVTVTGSVKEPQNLIFRIGTPIIELIGECGGFEGTPTKVILGGPMMGQAQSDLNIPATKGTSGILVLNEDEVANYSEAGPCIRCARCVDACPAKLVPTALVNLSKVDMSLELQDYNVLDCIECGSCTYVCPANIEILQWIKLGKEKLQAELRKSE